MINKKEKKMLYKNCKKTLKKLKKEKTNLFLFTFSLIHSFKRKIVVSEACGRIGRRDEKITAIQ